MRRNKVEGTEIPKGLSLLILYKCPVLVAHGWLSARSTEHMDPARFEPVSPPSRALKQFCRVAISHFCFTLPKKKSKQFTGQMDFCPYIHINRLTS